MIDCPTIKLVVVVCPGRVSSGLRDAHTALTHPLELHAAAKRLPLLLPIIVHLSWDQACGVSSMLRGQRSSRAFNGHVGTNMGIHVHGLDPASAHHMEGSFVLPVVTSSFDCRQHTGVPYTLFRPERTEPTANICHLWGLFSRPLLLFSCPLSPNANPQASREHAGDRAGAAGGTRAGGTRADGMQAGDASVADRCEAARGRDEVTLILDEDGMIDMKDAEPCKLRLYMRALLYS